MEKAGAIFVGKTNSPVFGFRGTCDNYLFGPSKNPFDLTQEHRRLFRRQRRRGGGGTPAALRRHRRRRLDPHPVFVVRRLWIQAVFRTRAAGDAAGSFRRHYPFIFEGPITRTVEDAALGDDRARRLRFARPILHRGRGGFHGRAHAPRSRARRSPIRATMASFPSIRA